ncbi:hypothetical protein IMZ31_23700 (plasmid) [Pontibacillus sp. ALD_SL1]|uniref:hypothetical protein n=1 Tax=Pontibacillus sp. ALD_SL1 TaxID=2777185 RepID=UPI001A957CF1|nr:hypothetical protein [Pontibacillus sp. ALD_SL1]QST02457.1 hypothetical protein IMZ31_23700 [Pontibacillus sp. ALD_SL1]
MKRNVEEKRFEDMNQDELRYHALSFCDDGSFYKGADELHWTFRHMETEVVRKKEKISQTPSEWIDWIEYEQKGRSQYWGYDSVGMIETYWLEDPSVEPIILMVDQEGSFVVGDGYHRFAIAIRHGLKSIPTLIGE